MGMLAEKPTNPGMFHLYPKNSCPLSSKDYRSFSIFLPRMKPAMFIYVFLI